MTLHVAQYDAVDISNSFNSEQQPLTHPSHCTWKRKHIGNKGKESNEKKQHRNNNYGNNHSGNESHSCHDSMEGKRSFFWLVCCFCCCISFGFHSITVIQFMCSCCCGYFTGGQNAYLHKSVYIWLTVIEKKIDSKLKLKKNVRTYQWFSSP